MEIKGYLTSIIILFLLGATGFAASIYARQPGNDDEQKQIVITIDDLPLNGPNIGARRLAAMTAKLLSVIAKNKIPVVGFVNESLLYVPGETEERIDLLKKWTASGVELGNHTFSHTRFKDVSLADYEDDFIRGEAVTRMLVKPQKMRYFRHPYLQMGTTHELENAFENFIGERGYRIAPVTIDDMDWMFMFAYLRAKSKSDSKRAKKVSSEYLKYASEKIDFCEAVSADLFGRQPSQILLLHSNELVADNLDDLLKTFKDKGYRFVALDEALNDPIYKFPDKYSDTSDWLSGWASSKGKKLTPPQPPEFIQKEFQNAQK